MNTESTDCNDGSPTRSSFFYGWVIVAACAVLLIVSAGLTFSFGVLFKPIVADFGWSRAATSGVYSIRLLIQAVSALPLGWLADRYGPARVMIFCALMVGLGMVLTSQINALWQLYLTYGLIFGIGTSGGFAITSATTARWFVRRRGLALGVMSSGVGLGTLAIVPITERLIDAFDWSRACLILGIAAGVVMIAGALLLRRSPEDIGQRPYGMKELVLHPGESNVSGTKPIAPETDISLRGAVRTKPLWMLVFVYFLFAVSLNMVMLHLVNYATDLHISSLMAATFVSVVGASGIVGRLAMGTASDRIGGDKALAICCAILAVTLVWLIFSREPWMFYLFAVVFGFAYGGEIPQIPALIGRFFGLRALAALVGTVVAAASIGGALGSWLGGQIFDATGSYQVAFVIAALAALCSLVITLMLKKQNSP
ncbi:MFS transporter [Chloroflexota bacterium]